MNERITPWGTVVAGAITLATATVIGLVHVGGWTVPFRTAGPGAVMVVGALIVLAGLFAVLRSTRNSARKAGPASQSSTSTPGQEGPQTTTEPVPAAQGPAESLSVEGPDGDAAQSNH